MNAAHDTARWADRLAVVATIPERLGARALPLVEEAIAAQISSQQGPDGAPWAATSDGHPALQNAMGDLTSVAQPDGFDLVLGTPSAYHDQGRGHAPRRQILPDGSKVPPAYAAAIDLAFALLLEEAG